MQEALQASIAVVESTLFVFYTSPASQQQTRYASVTIKYKRKLFESVQIRTKSILPHGLPAKKGGRLAIIQLSIDEESVYRGMMSAADMPSPIRSSLGPALSSRILSDTENQLMNEEIDRWMRILQDVSKGSIIRSSIRKSQSPSEPRCIHSEKETEPLDKKIDRLIAAIEDGRQLSFSSDTMTGEVDISAAYNNKELDRGSDLEECIAASPENFGTIIKPGNRRRRVRSINSRASDGSGLSQARSIDSSITWERAIATANLWSAFEQSSMTQDPTFVHERLPPINPRVDINEGRYLAFIENSKCKVRTISPIPFNLSKRPRPSTPSIHSDGSELDCSSPLFKKSEQTMLAVINVIPSPTGSQEGLLKVHDLKRSVSSWLEGVESPPRGEEATPNKGKDRVVGVFKDDQGGISASRKGPRLLPGSQALADVSNMRRPGYLQKNSFAKDEKHKRNSIHHNRLGSPFVPLGERSDHESRRKLIQSKRPALLTSNKRYEKQSSIEDETLSDLDQTPEGSTSAARPTDESPEKASQSKFTLARLGGRMLPPSSSPIRRYADMKATYGPGIQLETQRMRRDEPRSRSFHRTDNAVQNLEAAAAGAEPELGEYEEERTDRMGDLLEVSVTPS